MKTSPSKVTWLLAMAPAFGASCGEPRPLVVPPVTTAHPASPEHVADRAPKGVVTRREDIVEPLHGVSVADPYRWLEDADSAEVRTWTDAQNARTREVMDSIPGREAVKGDITELLQVGFVSGPVIRRGKGATRYFHVRREGTQNQPVLYVREGVSGKDRVLVDVSTMSADGTTALDWWFPSWDGRYLAWGRSESGSEDSVLHIRDVATGKDLPDAIERTRHVSVAWVPDGNSFYYSRYPEPGSVPAGEERYHSRIFHHVLGADAKTDALVFGDGREKTDIPVVSISPNGRWLVVRVHMGWDKSEVYLRDLSKGNDSPWKDVAVKSRALFEPIVRNDRLWIHTNDGASRYRLFSVDYAKPERAAWREVVPEGADVLNDVDITQSEIVATYMHDASSRIERFTHGGASKGAIALPGIGSAVTTSTHDTDEVFVSFTSYVVPSEVHRVALGKPARLEPWDRVGAKFAERAQAAGGFDVTPMFATSKDGTRVPMFVISKRGVKRDGTNPTVLYGYGGFNVNQTPAFSARALASVLHGAVWVTAVLRGGGEFGEAWHQAGMLEKKQNVFDDLFACAETLVRERITTSDKLGVMGGSNGGLLVAAAVTQRPELFRVGLSLVPLTDMIRYHKYRIAKLWIPEYGDPERADQFPFLYAYSPYHRVVDGKRYPSMLFTTAESDTRVDPMHARKMAARMQAAQGDASRPVLLRVETKAGHGAGKPVTKLADELTDELSFLFRELGVAR